ncbi:MAG: endonuclease/exonuclease/phosphatase family protein [Rubricoccaceae bacterium]|nr:endonuclease/exonuclease/phosphatase family protein [Rubricoccaceae bacterium]
MATVFSFASWNVEHFKNDRARAEENIAFLSAQDPDVFAVYEVEGGEVFAHFVELMPSHNIFVTEDLGDMEILIGVRRSLVAFITQRHELKSKLPTLRPGALVTLTIDDAFYSLLFVHLKSASDPRSCGLRDDMIGHVLGLKRALDNAVDGSANFIAVGDFNTMGMNLTYSDKDLSGAEEIERYRRRFDRKGMRLLSKSADATWWNGPGSSYDPSDLDHVFASDHLQFAPFGGAEVAVRGWPEEGTDAQKGDWIERHSDHALLYGEVVA